MLFLSTQPMWSMFTRGNLFARMNIYCFITFHHKTWFDGKVEDVWFSSLFLLNQLCRRYLHLASMSTQLDYRRLCHGFHHHFCYVHALLYDVSKTYVLHPSNMLSYVWKPQFHNIWWAISYLNWNCCFLLFHRHQRNSCQRFWCCSGDHCWFLMIMV